MFLSFIKCWIFTFFSCFFVFRCFVGNRFPGLLFFIVGSFKCLCQFSFCLDIDFLMPLSYLMFAVLFIVARQSPKPPHQTEKPTHAPNTPPPLVISLLSYVCVWSFFFFLVVWSTCVLHFYFFLLVFPTKRGGMGAGGGGFFV